jgi:hypothetical protein
MGEELFYYENEKFVEGMPDFSILEDEQSPAAIPPEDEEQDTTEE